MQGLSYCLPVLGLALAAFAVSAEDANLLDNGSFEVVVDGAPAQWSLFVEPMAGAFGRIDTKVAREGDVSAMLHNPAPYADEPCNNWSQPVYGRFGGARLVLSAWIRTEDAGEAAVWVQSWRRSPARVVGFETTATRRPMGGSVDWTRVEMAFTAPVLTDFLMVRCVLKGTGSAWFDDMRLERVVEAAVEPPEGAPAPDAPDDALAVDDRPEPPLDADVVIRDAFLDAHRSIIETNEYLRETNTVLLRQIEALERRLDQLQAEIGALRPPDAPAPETRRERGAVPLDPTARSLWSPRPRSSRNVPLLVKPGLREEVR